MCHIYRIPIPPPPPRILPACPISSASPPAAPPSPRAQQKGSRWPRGAWRRSLRRYPNSSQIPTSSFRKKIRHNHNLLQCFRQGCKGEIR